MLDHFQVISISHKKLNTEDLEQFVLKYDNDNELKLSLTKIKDQFDIEELVYLSTCNRLMILMYRPKLFAKEEIRNLLTQTHFEIWDHTRFLISTEK